MIEYGIWSDPAGGFIDVGYYGDTGNVEAERRITRARDGRDPEIDAEEAAKSEVVQVCADHEEQRHDDCDECLADEEDES